MKNFPKGRQRSLLEGGWHLGRVPWKPSFSGASCLHNLGVHLPKVEGQFAQISPLHPGLWSLFPHPGKSPAADMGPLGLGHSLLLGEADPCSFCVFSPVGFPDSALLGSSEVVELDIC